MKVAKIYAISLYEFVAGKVFLLISDVKVLVIL